MRGAGRSACARAAPFRAAARRLAAALVLASGSGLSAEAPAGCPEELVREAERVVAQGDEGAARARALCAAALADGGPLLLRSRCADVLLAAGDVDGSRRELGLLAASAPSLLVPAEWLALAVEADGRGDARAAMALYRRFAASAPSVPRWVEERRARLLLEAEAAAVRVRAAEPPSRAAREAFSAARDALARGRRPEAAAGFARALALAPGYAEAAVMLGAVEARQGRTRAAAAAYRAALAADPEHVEALLSLASILWGEPDRAAKEESLGLLERALTLRPEAVRPYRDAAERWAAWGDAARALDRLAVYRERVAGPERRETDALAARLEERLASVSAPAAQAPGPAPDTPALAAYRLAEVLAGRGGVDAALAAAREAAAADPAFAPAQELLASLLERSGDLAAAEAALRRTVLLDPFRVAAHERLAELLARRPSGAAAAEAAWRDAERAGSREALAVLAGLALGRGEAAEARRLYGRYLEEAPEGLHAADARRFLASWEARRRRVLLAASAAVPLVLLPPAVVLYRRRRGTTLAAWLARDGSRVPEVRPIVGRLRHEALKHGGLLLGAAAERLASDDPEARREAADLLLTRLFGPGGTRGLLAEARGALTALDAAARASGVVLNLRHKDPLLAPVARALAELAATRRPLEAIRAAPDRTAGRAAACGARLSSAARVLGPGTSAALGRLIDEAGATRVDPAALSALLAAVAREKRLPAAQLEVAPGAPAVRARMDRSDWETLWRNLLANVLEAGQSARPGVAPRLALSVEEAPDPVTFEARVRVVLADDVPAVLTAEMIRGRSADRGLGVVADLVSKHEGTIDVTGPPAGTDGLRKAVVVELPALEEGR